jgi:hypothetical protein
MDVQQRYWQEFIDLKRDAFYIAFYHRKTEKVDRALSGFIALTSSSAIAGWILWHESVAVLGLSVDFRLVWSVMIMLSQVITAVKDHLPYRKRLNALSGMSNDLNSLAIGMENDWFKVGRGLLTDEEINDLHIDMKRRKNAATMKNFPNMSLPEDKRLLERADADTQVYVQTFFGEERSS